MEKIQSPSKKIRKGDLVVAIAGNHRGQKGTVLACRGERIVVQGLNVRKKHLKRTEDAPKGRIIEMEAPIHVSNLKLCVEGDVGVKLKVRKNKENERQFVYKNGDKEIVYRSVKKPK